MAILVWYSWATLPESVELDYYLLFSDNNIMCFNRLLSDTHSWYWDVLVLPWFSALVC